jgi:aldehyde:ferredoxin oxidoreductase
MLCSGAETIGKMLGVTRVPTVKGQTVAAYDPRGIKGLGVTYATSPQGGDHTAGHTVRAPIDKLQAEGQWEVSLKAQIGMGMYDSIGGCMFFGTAIGPDWELLCDLLNARYGWSLDRDDLSEMGKEVLRQERAFNLGAGFERGRDRLPRFMEMEPLPPHNTVFDVSDSDLDRVAEI